MAKWIDVSRYGVDRQRTRNVKFALWTKKQSVTKERLELMTRVQVNFD